MGYLAEQNEVAAEQPATSDARAAKMPPEQIVAEVSDAICTNSIVEDTISRGKSTTLDDGE